MRPIDRLLSVMARLRDPEGGCPWDAEQDFASIAPYTLEEAYEVLDAVERGDRDDLREELGDLLLQVVYHARMAEEAGWFDFDAVAEGVASKMVRRHPHVFGEGGPVADAADQGRAWEAGKEAERRSKDGDAAGALAGVALALPALIRARKLQARAARVGFDWPTAEPVFAKVLEELAEVRAAGPSGSDAVEEEIGDLLFTAVNLARKLGVEPEAALRRANAKFVRRFERMEASAAADGRPLAARDARGLDDLWSEAKRRAAD